MTYQARVPVSRREVVAAPPGAPFLLAGGCITDQRASRGREGEGDQSRRGALVLEVGHH